MARVIPDQPSRIPGLVGERQRLTDAKTFKAAKKKLAVRSIRDGFGRGWRVVLGIADHPHRQAGRDGGRPRAPAPARSPMARTIPDPTEHIPGSSKRPARSRSSRISRQSDRRVTKSASSSVTNSVTTGITQATGPPPRRTSRPFWTSARPSMARVIPDQPSCIPGPVPRLARTRPGRTSR